jgi:hypothetical protein
VIVRIANGIRDEQNDGVNDILYNEGLTRLTSVSDDPSVRQHPAAKTVKKTTRQESLIPARCLLFLPLPPLEGECRDSWRWFGASPPRIGGRYP